MYRMRIPEKIKIKRWEDFLIKWPLFFGIPLAIGLVFRLRIFELKNIQLVFIICLGGGYCSGWLMVGYCKVVQRVKDLKKGG